MDISNTLKKVEKALNLRFERDSSLYISKEDTEKIKDALYHSKFQNINAFIKKFGNKIVGKVILNNSWLIQFHKNERELKKIFDGIDRAFLKDVSQDIIDDKIFSTTEFKLFIKQYYLESIPLEDCPKIYKETTELIQSRVTCFKRYLKEEYILENSASNIVRFIDSEFRNYPEIYNHIQTKDSAFLSSVFNGYIDLDDVIEWIILNKITDRKDRVWNSLFLSNKDRGFKKSIDYISNNSSWDNNKHFIPKNLAKLHKAESFEDSIVELYNNHYDIRLLFLRMLEPTRFKDKKLAHIILDRFESIGFPNKDEGLVEKIRNWQEASSSKQGFKNIQEIIDSIENAKHNFSNLKTLDYYSSQLNRTDKDIILELYEKFNN